MSDQAGAAPITLERNGDAAVARPQMKMMDDQALKTLIRMINEAATPDAGVDLVVLELSRVTILPSLALGLLVQIAREQQSFAAKLRFVGFRGNAFVLARRARDLTALSIYEGDLFRRLALQLMLGIRAPERVQHFRGGRPVLQLDERGARVVFRGSANL